MLPVSSTGNRIQSFDEYRLVALLGRGGMGEVYLGHDTLLDRPVAIKFIRTLQPDAALRELLLNEARAAARLQHPNVPIIHRIGEIDGQPFIVSEFIQGRSLDRIPKPIQWQRALKLSIGLCRALAAAHRHGVLHRVLEGVRVGRGHPFRTRREGRRNGRMFTGRGAPRARPGDSRSSTGSAPERALAPERAPVSRRDPRCRGPRAGRRGGGRSARCGRPGRAGRPEGTGRRRRA